MNTKNSQSKELTQARTLDEIKENLGKSKTGIDPDYVLEEADREITNKKVGPLALSPESKVFKAMTLLEFDNGMLMTTAVSEQYKTFGIDLMRNIQKEYNCQTQSEKATAELVAVNYIRTLEVQRRINNYLELGTISDTGVRFLDIMGKELDRANRHYLTAIQALKAMKQPQLELNIKANTAVIGQNQIVQTNKISNDF